MKLFILIFSCSLITINIACQKTNEENANPKDLTQEQESEILDNMLSEIITLSESERCNDASNWLFTSYGSKACGGPIGYIPYSKNIDTEAFLKKVEAHKIAQKEFNQKWGIASDCALAMEPSGLDCKDGKPVFKYDYNFTLHENASLP